MTEKKPTYDLSLLHVGDWTRVPMGHPVGVWSGEKLTVLGTITKVDAEKGTITIEVDGK